MQKFTPKPRKRWQTYNIDGLILGMFAAVSLDMVTTYIFLSLKLGSETNPVGALLYRQSLIWVPIFMLIRPALVPLLPKIARDAFAVIFLVQGLYFGVNNLGGIVLGQYFLVGIFGSQVSNLFCFSIGLIIFLYKLFKDVHAWDERYKLVNTSLGLLVIFLLLEGIFYLIGVLFQPNRVI